jgi:hypothetical protein
MADDEADAVTTIRDEGPHGDVQKFPDPLVRILEPQLRPDLGGAEQETKARCSRANRSQWRIARLEAELGHREGGEVDIRFRRSQREVRLVERFVRQIADSATCYPQGAAERVDISVEAERDRPPGRYARNAAIGCGWMLGLDRIHWSGKIRDVFSWQSLSPVKPSLIQA